MTYGQDDHQYGKRPWDLETQRRLLRAGWEPGRDVWARLRLPTGFEPFPVAKRILSEFGDLTFSEDSGRTCLDPSLGERIADEIKEYEIKIGRRLYPIGKVDGGDVLDVLVDETGLVYTLTDRLEPFASSFDQAIKYLACVCAYEQREYQSDLESVGMFDKSWNLNR